jgi:NADH dehydrogenase [ubiquinone] 1 alpha subcomplex assembly factor 7
MNPFETRLKEMIVEGGPMDVGTFMTLAIGHYYSTRDPFGVKGDFTTAPEISQMFGEMIGAFLADAWIKMGSPSPVLLAEAGPGRGTLMADIMRATKNVPGFHAVAQIHLIEMSPVLMARQKDTLKDYNVQWWESLASLPGDCPVLFVANEFLDALPVRQFQFQDGAWFERLIGVDGDRFVFGLAPSPYPLLGGETGDVFEIAPLREDFVKQLAERIKAQSGVALLIDYGHDRHGPGDTLQAIKDHQYVDVLSHIGEADLTAHVDFESLAAAAKNVAVFGPVGQGDFLKALGIELRAARLGQSAELERLTVQMGQLFRVMALCHDDKIQLAGFA